MQGLTKINGIYYFRLRVPHNLRQWFPSPILKKSLQTKRYEHAKSQARHLLGNAERVFAMVRSKLLDAAGIQKIIAEFIESTLELKYDTAEDALAAPEMQGVMEEIYSDSRKAAVDSVKRRAEVGVSNLPFASLSAEYLCHSAGYEADGNAPEYKKLVHELAIAKRDIIATLQERLDTGDSAYDTKQREKQAKQLEERSKSNTLSELIAAYCGAKDNVTGRNRRGKLSEKMDKIKECFQYETGKKDILLSDITTVR